MPIRMVDATCVGGSVSLEGAPVASAEFLSEGVASSEGIALMQEDRAVYLTSSASDLKEAIDQVVAIAERISAMMLSITTGMTGPSTAPPGTFAADKVLLDLAIVELDALKDLLK